MKNKKTIITTISAIALILISLVSYKLLTNDKSAESDPSKTIISNYKGGKVTLKKVQNELNKLALRNEKLRGITFDKLSSDQKETIIKEVILKEIAYKEAKKRSLHKKKDYKEALKSFETEILKQQLYDDIAKKAGSEENIREYYDNLAKELAGKKDVRVRYISIKTEKEVIALHKQLMRSPKSFANKAKRKSLDKESAKNGGDLGYVIRDKLQPEIAAATKSLKKGEISKPISLTDKWVIIKLEDERDTEVAKFEDVRDALAQNLSQKALQEFISGRLEKAKINIVVK